MSYSPAVRFGASPPVGDPLVSLLTSTARTTVQNLGLARLIEVKRRRAREDEDAVRAVKAGLLLDSVDDTDVRKRQITDSATGRSLLTRIAKFVGKQLFKRIAKSILRFAMRAAMQVARIAVRQVLRMVIVPVLEGLFVFAVSNPITAAAMLALLATGGIGYWAWQKFFKEKDAVPVASTDVASQTQGQSQVADIDTTTIVSAPIAQANVEEVSMVDRVTAPVRFVRNVARSRGGFAGFGDDVDRSIKVASQMFGLPEDVLRGFIKMEAGWTGAMSPTGAIGAGQFIQSTWDGLARTRDGRAIGMTVIGPRFRRADDPRRDSHINILATSLLARENARMLSAAGLPLTGENLYMMHNIGPGIIPVMLGRPASEKTLLAMRQNGMQPNQTAAEFLTFQKQRFMGHYRAANQSQTEMAAAAAQAQAVSVERKKKKKAVVTTDVTKSSSTNPAPTNTTIVRGPGKTLVAIK